MSFAKLILATCFGVSASATALAQNIFQPISLNQPYLVASDVDTPSGVYHSLSADQEDFLANSRAITSDSTLLKIDGEKKKLRRSETLNMAQEVIRTKALADGDTASANKYLYCVSKAMNAEKDLPTSIFSPKNITATYTKLAATPYPSTGGNIRFGISRLCDRLNEYASKMNKAAPTMVGKKDKGAKDLSSSTWNAVLTDYYKINNPAKTPDELEKLATANRQNYCLFGSNCSIDVSNSTSSSIGGVASPGGTGRR